MRLSFVLGSAAELIKAYPLIVEAEERKYSWAVISTGENPVSLTKQIEDFGFDPAKIIHAVNTSYDIQSILGLLWWMFRVWRVNPRKFVPSESNVVIVQGDSFSTVAGARWGRKLGLPVVHVEAGLRSSKLLSPFPQEINRRMVSRRATLHMAPDDLAAQNLKAMGYEHGVLTTGGNTLADAVRLTLQKNPIGDRPAPYVLANLHRFENLHSGKRWTFLLKTLAKIANDRRIFFVMHPSTRQKVGRDQYLMQRLDKAGVVLQPMSPFSQFIRSIAQAEFVVTDGGSTQEECYYLGVPCLILRETTERAEGLHSNCILAKFDTDLVDDFISDPSRWRRPPTTPGWSPSALIMDALERELIPSRL